MIVDDVDEQEPTDVAYVFSGYAPLSVRLAQCAIGSAPSAGGKISSGTALGGSLNGWKGIEEVLKGLPGKTFDEIQPVGENRGELIEFAFKLTILNVYLFAFRYSNTGTKHYNRMLPWWYYLC